MSEASAERRAHSERAPERQHRGPQIPGDLRGTIRATVVDDDHLVRRRTRDTSQHVGDLPLLVEDGRYDGDGEITKHLLRALPRRPEVRIYGALGCTGKGRKA